MCVLYVSFGSTLRPRSFGCVENFVGSVYIGGYGGLSESGLCVFRELCPVSFLVVGECPSVLL